MSGAFQSSHVNTYDTLLVPLMVSPYAGLVADIVKSHGPKSVLELAAGTGILTLKLAEILPADTAITATDLNQPMIDQARAKPGMERVTWRQADAMKLPFPDESFDLVVCQFGVMFFPDKAESFQEARRVLKRGGKYVFVVWDDWEKSPDAPLYIATQVVGRLLPCDPASLINPPYFDDETIRADLGSANFKNVMIDYVRQPSTAPSARAAADATVQGSLIRVVIGQTDPARFDEATEAVEQAFRRQFGDGAIDGGTRVLVVTAEKG
jgi:SAM-dependent methyltransferase